MIGRTMGIALAALAAPAGAATQSCPPALTPNQATGPLADVRYLADDALEGRGLTTDGGLCATAYLAARSFPAEIVAGTGRRHVGLLPGGAPSRPMT